jgi:PAS fold
MADSATSTNLKDQAASTSPALAQTLPSDAVLDALKMILLGAPLNEVLTTITRLIEAHSAGMLCSIFLLDEDGRYRWFLFRYNPLLDQQGRVARWFATATDIEDRKQTEQSLRNENLALREQIDRDSMFE